MFRSGVDPQAAFRAGLYGWRFRMAADAAVRGTEAFGFGPNERLAVQTSRLPGLTAARPAYECGRALRAVTKLLDRVNAPAAVGRQFVDNLAAACLAHGTRRAMRPWGAEETVGMFLEMYERILEPAPHELEFVRASLLAYANDETAALPGSRAPEARR